MSEDPAAICEAAARRLLDPAAPVPPDAVDFLDSARLSGSRRPRPGGAQPRPAAARRRPLHPAVQPRLPDRAGPRGVRRRGAARPAGRRARAAARRRLGHRRDPARCLRGLRRGGDRIAVLGRDRGGPGQPHPGRATPAGLRGLARRPAAARHGAGWLGRAVAAGWTRHRLAAGRALPAPPALAPGFRTTLAAQRRLCRRADAGGGGAARPARTGRARCRGAVVARRPAGPAGGARGPGDGGGRRAARRPAPGRGRAAKLAARPHHRSRCAGHRRALDRGGVAAASAAASPPAPAAPSRHGPRCWKWRRWKWPMRWCWRSGPKPARRH